MKTTPRHGKAAFTLIELMAVITIIVILAGLVVGGLSYVTDKQAKSKANVQIALLSKALEEYKLDMGQYPPTTDKTGNLTTAAGTSTSSILYQALFKDGYDYTSPTTPPSNWDVKKPTKIYLADLDPAVSKQGWTIVGKTTIVDPWGNEYCYRTATGTPPANGSAPVNASTQNPDFDLWSMGKDGKTNASDPSLKVPPPPNNRNVDDIRNF